MTNYDSWKTDHPAHYEDDVLCCCCCGDEIDYDHHEAPSDLSEVCASCEEDMDAAAADDWSALFTGPEMMGAATALGGGR